MSASGLLDSLLARARGEARTVRPRLPGRFEPLGPSVEVGAENATDADAWGRVEVEEERPTRRASRPRSRGDAPSVRQGDEHSPRRPSVEISAASLRPTLAPALPMPGPTHSAANASTPRAVEGEPWARASGGERPEPAAPRVPSTRPETRFEPRPEATTPRRTRSAELANPEPPLPSVRPVLEPEAAPTLGARADRHSGPAAPEASRPLAAPLPSPPRVEVRIGRIEVRTATPPSVSTAASMRAAGSLARRSVPRPSVSLDDYLRRKRGS